MTGTNFTGKFPTGRIVATPGAIETFPGTFLDECFRKHISGDWGITPASDAKLNEAAVTSGDRIISAYMHDGEKLWVITEGENEHRVTTLLLPTDY